MDVKNKNSYERNYGIDFLKILCMLMVVILHILGQGRVLDSVEFLSLNYGAAWLGEIGVLCAVNCYALISGYVGLYSKHKYTNIVMLWLQVLLYNIVITLLLVVCRDDIYGGLFVYAKMFFPVITKQYWYFTTYFALFFVMPCYNCIIEYMPQKQLKRILAVIIVLFSIIPTAINRDIFDLIRGYGFVWISLLYIIGGYFRKYNVIERMSIRKWLLLYATAVVITFCEKYFSEGLVFYVTGEAGQAARLCFYTSPTMLLAAIALLGIFSQKTFKGISAKILPKLSASAFGVYLIHAHPLVYDYILNDRYIWVAGLSTVKMIIAVLGIAIVIFTICIIIDLVRAFVFSKLHTKDFLMHWELKLLEGKKDDEGTKS